MKKEANSLKARVSIATAVLTFLFLVTFNSFSYDLDVDEAFPVGSGKLLYIHGNKQIAGALCFGKSPMDIEVIYFKGPSGIKLRVSLEKNSLSGHINRFSSIIEGKEFYYQRMYSNIHAQQSLPIPIIADVNGKFRSGFFDIADRGKGEIVLNKFVKEELEKLPSPFLQALSEFYLFGEKSIPGISIIAFSLTDLFPDMKPYEVKHVRAFETKAANAFLSDYFSTEK